MSKTKRKALDALETYMAPRLEQMRYPEFKAMGLDIGSGPMESGCKNVIGSRLKGPGMRWRADNAATIAELRCQLKSGSWDHVENLIASN